MSEPRRVVHDIPKAALVDLVGALERAIREWEEYSGPCDSYCEPEYYCSALRKTLELTQGALLLADGPVEP